MSASIDKFKETKSAINTQYVSQGYNTKLCGQTVLSMIIGKPTEQICKELQKDGTTNIIKDLKPYLEKNGFDTEYKKVRTFKDIPNNSIVLLEFPDESQSGHYTLKINNVYYDPAVGILKNYNEETRLPHSFLKFKKTEKK
ncbi:hypothetical protein ACQY1Q_06010 [Tenacibaculum sp. TC6]|uniref:hypothetical protein n=1 Tax=Tenacibaculum sp. TC6 TaxID=3423223 RepID=UPI003D35F3DA